jgi:hypothetical protein
VAVVGAHDLELELAGDLDPTRPGGLVTGWATIAAAALAVAGSEHAARGSPAVHAGIIAKEEERFRRPGRGGGGT